MEWTNRGKAVSLEINPLSHGIYIEQIYHENVTDSAHSVGKKKLN
jgi:hypothetical protein